VQRPLFLYAGRVETFLIAILILAIVYLVVALRFATKKNAHLQEVITRARRGYNRHLRSYYWKVVSELSKRRDRYTCRICGRKRPHVQLQSHHPKNYDEVLYDEKPEDLTTLCAECHHAITVMLRLRRLGIRFDQAILPQYQIESSIN
jgi:5-methylcytosine-specific restriction endonuclease McrA